MRPEFSNSKIMIKDNIKIDDKVEAACWLNVEDEDLRKRMVAYFNDTTKKNINVVLSRRIGDSYDKTKVATFNLFINTPKEEKKDNDDIL
ncbi:hypothetical protein [uncultured Mediterranean phage uvMED]|nr:hypothetical protein [uncultured Mediterranean phage uvMED]|tara:strand:- start:976 stop:1245 length:270 start_codon:yes stop_codon:yes gene_type:complete